MMDNDSKFYPNQMSNSVDAPKQQGIFPFIIKEIN